MGSLLVFLLAVWAWDKLVHRTFRLTRMYVARRRRGGWIEIACDPWPPVYRRTAAQFFAARNLAYDRLADMLSPDAPGVLSRSLWLRYDEPGWSVKTKANTPWFRLLQVALYWANTANWSREPGTSWWSIGNKTFVEARMSRADFIQWRRGGGQPAVSDHGLE